MKPFQIFALMALASLALLGTGEAWGQKKKKGEKKDGTAAEVKDYIAIQSSKELIGSIQNADSKSVVLRVDIPHVEKNPDYQPGNGGGGNNMAAAYMQHMQTMMGLQAQFLRATSPAQAMQAKMAMFQQQQQAQVQVMRQMQNQARGVGGNGAYKVVMDHKDFELETVEKLIIRKMFLDTNYDDKGNLIEYNKETIAKLKGSGKYPGYAAKFEDIQPGMLTRLVLVPVANPVKKNTKEEDLVGKLEKPTVRVLILLQEKAATTSSGK